MGWVLFGLLLILMASSGVLLPLLGIVVVSAAVYSFMKGKENQEKAAIIAVRNEVDAIISHFSPAEIIINRQAVTYQISPELLNIEVIDSVHRYKAWLTETAALTRDVDQRISHILSCPGCTTPLEKLSYLNSQKEDLNILKNESDDYHSRIEGCKLQLLHEDSDKLFNIKKASLALLSSKKCTSNATSRETFITDKRPYELSMFHFECEPVIFQLDNFYFCLFSNVILVFDYNGIFSAALDPTALVVRVERETTQYRYNSNIDSDSNAVTYTEIRRRWLYACKDGSPDLRYKGNHQIEYPVEVNGFEYGRIFIGIGEQSVEFSISSSHALDLFEKTSSIYCHTSKHKHNPLPYLLGLLESVSEDSNTAEHISNRYLSATANKNYFCKLVTN